MVAQEGPPLPGRGLAELALGEAGLDQLQPAPDPVGADQLDLERGEVGAADVTGGADFAADRADLRSRAEQLELGDPRRVGDLAGAELVVGDAVGRGVEQAEVEVRTGQRARAQNRRGALGRPDQALEQLEGGAVEQLAADVGRRGLEAVEGREGLGRDRVAATDDDLTGRDLAQAVGLLGVDDRERDPLGPGPAANHSVQREPLDHELRRAVDDDPALDPDLAQTEQPLLGPQRAAEQLDHAHHRQRRGSEGRAVVGEPGVLRARGIEGHPPAVADRRKAEGLPHHRVVDDAHTQARGLVDALAVDPQREVADHPVAALVGAPLDDLEGGGDGLVLGHDLAAVLPAVLVADGDRLEPGRGHARVHVELEHGPLEQLQHRLDAERAGLDRVLEEVGLEEPLAGLDGLLGPGVPELVGAAVGVPVADAVEHQQLRPSHARAPGGHARAVERDLEVARRVEQGPLLGSGREPGLVLERGGREEPEHGVEGVDQLASPDPGGRSALDLEADDDHRRGLAQAGVDDLGLQAAGVLAQLGVDGPGPVEVAEHQRHVGRQRAAHVAGQPAAGLERGLEQDGEGHHPAAVLGQVPRA